MNNVLYILILLSARGTAEINSVEMSQEIDRSPCSQTSGRKFYKNPCLGQKRRFIENLIPISKVVFIKQVSKFESPGG